MEVVRVVVNLLIIDILLMEGVFLFLGIINPICKLHRSAPLLASLVLLVLCVLLVGMILRLLEFYQEVRVSLCLDISRIIKELRELVLRIVPHVCRRLTVRFVLKGTRWMITTNVSSRNL